MGKNYLKTALRHFRINRAYTLINTCGLAIALAGFILVVLYSDHEHGFNRWSPQLTRVWQVNEWNHFNLDNPDFNALCNTQISTQLSGKIPGLIAMTAVQHVETGFSLPLNIQMQDGSLFSENGLLDCDSSFFKVFPYFFIEGNANGALDGPHSMVISETLAHKWFGDSAALGKAILVKQWMLDPGQTYRITGVVRIPPGPTTIPFDGIFDSGENEARAEHESVHGAELYLLLAGGTSADRVTREADRIYTQGLAEALPEGSSFLNDFQKSSLSAFIRSGNRFGLRLLPFENLHLHPPSGPSPMQKILSLTLLALMLLWIGISNYTNLAIVQAMTRAREIGVRKVLGARRTQIALQILVESFCQCSAALFLGLILVELLLPWFNGAFGTSISLWYSQSPGTLMIQLLAILLGTTLLAGAYPALVISGYASSRVLKGNFSRSREGALVRQILILLQFGISVVFFTGLVIVNRQVHFLEHRDPGFSAVGLINLSDIRDSAVEERIRRIPGVIAVGPSTQVMGSSMEFQIPVRYQGRQVSLSQSSVGLQSLQALNVHLISGRLFSDQSGQDKYNSVVVNQSAARALGGDVIGQTIMENDTVAQQIIGVIGDYQFEGFNQPILPTLYAVNHRGPSSNMPNLLVRYNPLQERRVIASIRTIWKSVHPGYLIHYNFLTKQYAKLLQDDTRFLHIIQTFTGLSILLSLMGIFALSAFTAGERSREIGVRRVMGATVTDILRLLNRDFVLLVALANLAGWPVAFLLGRQWLNGFVFRIAMPLYAFFWAGVLTLLVTILTVTFQAYHTAAANPAQTLRHE